MLRRGRDLEVVLVGNELFQQFPLTGYGGIETSVENIAFGLHRMGVPFWVITPGRAKDKPIPAYPFDVMETIVAPNGQGGKVPEYVAQGLDILRTRVDHTGARVEKVAATWKALGRRARGSTKGALLPPPTNASVVVWGQSDWSQDFSPLSVAEITSHHDGGGPIGGWDRHLHNVGHRFLSFDQRSKWVAETDTATLKRTRVVPHGLPPDDYSICPDGGYLLWVASLDWGWEEKGLHIFTDLARQRPDLKFVAYGSTTRRQDIAARLREIAGELPNFEYRGELKRGPEHRAAFCGAIAFFMPTHHRIGESFGMTVIESLSKGVPVIASTSGAVPEILAVPNRKGFSPYGAACDTLEEYAEALRRFEKRDAAASAAIQRYAREKYDVHVTVDALLAFSLDVLEGKTHAAES